MKTINDLSPDRPKSVADLESLLLEGLRGDAPTSLGPDAWEAIRREGLKLMEERNSLKGQPGDNPTE